MKKIISVVGARPNFMKVAPIDRVLSKLNNVQHLIVHTGQHYDKSMSDSFFDDLEMPSPAYFLGIGSGSHAVQTAKIMIEFEQVLLNEKPDLVLVVGDVNSTLACSITAKKLGIQCAHIEAGLRSFDRTMPEELNRIVTDSICDYLFTTEYDGNVNLASEGISKDKVFFVGNTMIDSLCFALDKEKLSVLDQMELKAKNYAVFTMHRPSNVDFEEQLSDMLDVLDFLTKKIKVLFPLHPRTKNNLEKFGLVERFEKLQNIMVTGPSPYLEFITLVNNSSLVVTDSGGIQEETTFLGIPCFTLRNSTERPITCEIGTNVLIQPRKDIIIEKLNEFFKSNKNIGIIPTFWDGKSSERIVNIILNQILSSK